MSNSSRSAAWSGASLAASASGFVGLAVLYVICAALAYSAHVEATT